MKADCDEATEPMRDCAFQTHLGYCWLWSDFRNIASYTLERNLNCLCVSNGKSAGLQTHFEIPQRRLQWIPSIGYGRILRKMQEKIFANGPRNPGHADFPVFMGFAKSPLLASRN